LLSSPSLPTLPHQFTLSLRATLDEISRTRRPVRTPATRRILPRTRHSQNRHPDTGSAHGEGIADPYGPPFVCGHRWRMNSYTTTTVRSRATQSRECQPKRTTTNEHVYTRRMHPFPIVVILSSLTHTQLPPPQTRTHSHSHSLTYTYIQSHFKHTDAHIHTHIHTRTYTTHTYVRTSTHNLPSVDDTCELSVFRLDRSDTHNGVHAQ
jgi:hypothetical protein